MRDNLLDSLIIIIISVGIFIVLISYIYLLLSAVFWDLNYNNWTKIIVDGGLIFRLILILFYYIVLN